MYRVCLSKQWLSTIVALWLLSVVGCGYGSKVEHGNIEVYYKDGTTQAEADRLGEFLTEYWGTGGGRKSVQLLKSGEGYIFRMVIAPEYQHNNEILQDFAFDAARISREVVDGAAVEFQACDERFTTLKTVPPRKDIRYSLVQGKAELFYPAEVEKQEAERLCNYLAKLWEQSDSKRVSFKLVHGEGVVKLHVVIKEEAIDNPNVTSMFAQDQAKISTDVFQGKPVEIHLCDDRFKVFKVLKPKA